MRSRAPQQSTTIEREPAILADRAELLPPRTPAPKSLDLSAPVWTSAEVAMFLRCSAKNVINQARAGKIPGTQIGGMWRFKRSQIESLI